MARMDAHTGTRVGRWAEVACVLCLGALLFTLPLWRHRVLLHRGTEELFYEFHDVILYTNDIFWLASLGFWLVSLVLNSSAARLRLGPWFLWAPLAGLCAASLLGIPFAVDPLMAGYQSLRLVLLLATCLMVINLPLTAGAVAWPLAAAMVLQAAVAVPQFVLRRSLGLRWLGEVPVRAAWSGASVVMVGEERWLRAYGLVQHPNLLAGCMMALLLLVGGYYLLQTGWRRIPLLIALGAGLGTLLLTFSRAAWLGVAAGGAVAVVLLLWAHRQGQWSAQRQPLVTLGAVALVVVGAFAVTSWPLLQPRLGLAAQGVEIRSVDARLLQLRAARALIGMQPLAGFGLGNYATALYTFAREAVADYPVYQPVHNVLLLASAELGIAGGALWLWLILAPWLALWNRRKALVPTPWWAGVSGALASLSVVGFLDSYVWSSHQARLLMWLVLGLWARAWVEAASTAQGERDHRTPGM